MKLIPGPPLLGFHGLFEADFGDPETERPMRVVTPSFVGRSMLPFRCPRCREIPQELACPYTRRHYQDPRPEREDVHHCPRCGCRFRLDLRGVPLPAAIPAGAEVGPSRVERDGVTIWQDLPGIGGKVLSTILGMFAPQTAKKSGYVLLSNTRRRQIP